MSGGYPSKKCGLVKCHFLIDNFFCAWRLKSGCHSWAGGQANVSLRVLVFSLPKFNFQRLCGAGFIYFKHSFLQVIFFPLRVLVVILHEFLSFQGKIFPKFLLKFLLLNIHFKNHFLDFGWVFFFLYEFSSFSKKMRVWILMCCVDLWSVFEYGF